MTHRASTMKKIHTCYIAYVIDEKEMCYHVTEEPLDNEFMGHLLLV